MSSPNCTHTALAIAGSDPSGGAGIQADLKTFASLGTYGFSVVTALTCQNSVAVESVLPVSADFVSSQLDVLLQDFPAPNATKLGMLGTSEIVAAVARILIDYKLTNLVIDPVLCSTSGTLLLDDLGQRAMVERLFPLATVVTPNIPEASLLTGISIETIEDMKQAAQKIYQMGCQWVVIKGGHLQAGSHAEDVVYNGEAFHVLRSPRMHNYSVHGTGCTFASAIAAGLAEKKSKLDAIKQAKHFVTASILNARMLGGGQRMPNHFPSSY